MKSGSSTKKAVSLAVTHRSKPLTWRANEDWIWWEFRPPRIRRFARSPITASFFTRQNKKAHEQRKSSRGSQLKEVKFRPATAEHDYQVRKNQIYLLSRRRPQGSRHDFSSRPRNGPPGVGRAKMTRFGGAKLANTGRAGNHAAHGRQRSGRVLAPKKGVAVAKPVAQTAQQAQ